MNRTIVIAVVTLLSMFAGAASAEVVGKSTIGVTTGEMDQIVSGMSVKKDFIGKNVDNEQNQKIGKIEDIVINKDKSVSAAIVAVGGFLGMGKHDVAIPIEQFSRNGNKLVLAGATKDALKALPKFEYARHNK